MGAKLGQLLLPMSARGRASLDWPESFAFGGLNDRLGHDQPIDEHPRQGWERQDGRGHCARKPALYVSHRDLKFRAGGERHHPDFGPMPL